MNAKHTVLLEFTDPDDADRLCRCVGYAKKSDGTLPPLQCGLLTQALRRSEVRIDHAPELANALCAIVSLLDREDEGGFVYCDDPEITTARAVLAKLEGGSK